MPAASRADWHRKLPELLDGAGRVEDTWAGEPIVALVYAIRLT